jgi:hypothetical protein
MGVAHHHLQRSMPEQLSYGAQVDSGHNKSTGKSMAVAMPRVSVDLGFGECSREPATRSLKRIVAAQGREDRVGSLRLAGALLLFAFQIILVFQSVESAHSYDVQRNGPRIAVLGFGKMNLSPLEIDLVPAQTVLLAHAHPGVKGKQQVRQKLGKSMLDGLAQPRLFMIREKPHPSVALRLATDSGRGIALDLLVVNSDPKNQGKGRLPPISAAGCPVAFRGLLGQPGNDLAFPNRLCPTGTKNGQQLRNAKAEFVGLLGAIFGSAVDQGIVAEFTKGDRFGTQVFRQLRSFQLLRVVLGEKPLGVAA